MDVVADGRPAALTRATFTKSLRLDVAALARKRRKQVKPFAMIRMRATGRRSLTTRRWLARCAVPLLCGASQPLCAQHDLPLAELSLEQLSNIVVTLAARREQRLADAPASVYVITADDIRRSGARTLPEALRLAPNLQVARADANQYAITARGFGNVLANKLLVMIDGRIVYSPLFSGVFWEAQDVMLEDVERIEVLDGPATALWGTNAFNGVIHVVSKPARATQGTLLVAGGGNRDRAASARHGGMTANGGHFRIHGLALDIEDTHRAGGVSVNDASKRGRAGFRYDGPAGRDALTLQGDAYRGDIDQGAGNRDISGGNFLVRFERALGGSDSVAVQAYYDRAALDQNNFHERLATFDVDVQGRFQLDAKQLLTIGAGHRHQRDRVTNSAEQAFLPPDRNLDTAYAFVQDEIAITDRVAFTAGLKLEHNEYTGLEFLPSVRLRFQASPDHMAWAAVSRAVRAPSRIDRELFIPGRPPFALAGGPEFQSEVSNVVEGGVRGRFGSALSYSATVFRHEHDRLRSLEASSAGLVFRNGIEGHTSGIEGWLTFYPTPVWRLTAGGIELRQRLRAAPGVVDVGGLAALGNDPKRAYVLRSSLDIARDHELDVLVRHVGERPAPVVPSYTAVDVRWGWRLSPRVELSLTLENLTDDRHAEWGAPANRVEFERAWFLKVAVGL